MAEPDVNPTPNDAPYSIQDLGSSRFKVTLSPHSTASGTAFRITRGSQGESLDVKVTPSTDIAHVVDISIGTSNSPFADVGMVELSPKSGGPIYISALHAETLGTVRATRVTARLAGDAYGDIDLYKPSSDGPSYLDLRSTGGDLTANVFLIGYEAELRDLDFSQGRIGTAQDPIDIVVNGTVTHIRAGEIHANIRNEFTDGIYQFVDVVDLIETVTVSGLNGDFTGSLLTTAIETAGNQLGIRLVGKLRANVTVRGGFEQSSDVTTLTLPSFGLAGNFIINASQFSGATWNAPVKLGLPTPAITLRGTDFTPTGAYAKTSAEIGGGSVGLVPFQLHRTDCFPPHDSIIHPLEENEEEELLLTNKVCMVHYGPVAWDSGDGEPYEVRRRKAGSSDNWLLQDCFTCEMDEDNDTIVWVKTSSVTQFQRGFEYQVSRRQVGGENVLRCKLPHLTLSTYPEVADFDPLEFQVCDAFPAGALGDADNSGVVDAEDVDCALENWGSTACMKYGDADRNGAVNGEDLIIAEIYVEWTYCDTAPQGFMKVADGFAQMDFDGDSAAMSEPMTLTQAVQYMGYEDTADFAAGFDAMEAPARAAARAVLMALISGD